MAKILACKSCTVLPAISKILRGGHFGKGERKKGRDGGKNQGREKEGPQGGTLGGKEGGRDGGRVEVREGQGKELGRGDE